MRGRGVLVWFAAAVCVVGLLAPPATATARQAADPPAAPATKAEALDARRRSLPPPATYRAVGQLEQVTVTRLRPGATVELRYRLGCCWWFVRTRLVATTVADEQGSALFRHVEPGPNYEVWSDGMRSYNLVWVRDLDTPNPGQWFYDKQDLVEGYQYIRTRDGTTLSAYVVLPGPIEDGPYPTIVEYSGYDPSNPIGGIGSLAGGIDPTPLCGQLPILCKAPAEPASLLAGLLGYAVVGVNVRGTGCSGGAFDYFERMQLLDAYDVIETVGAQDWVQGHQVGMVGVSYPGISQLFTASVNPPSLAAITPFSVFGDSGTGVGAPGGMINTGFAVQWANSVLSNARPNGPGWVRELIADGDTTCEANQRLRLQNVDLVQKLEDNRFYTDEIAGPLDPRTFVGNIDVPVLFASAFQDEQTGPSFADLLDDFDASPSFHAYVYNGLHGDALAPRMLTEWAAFLDIYVAERVPRIEPILRFLAPIFYNAAFGAQMQLPPSRWDGVATVEEARAIWEAQPAITVLFENGNGTGPGAVVGSPVAAWEHQADSWPLPDTEARRWWFGADGSLTDEPSTDAEGTGVAFHPNLAVGSTSFYVGGADIWSPNPPYQWLPQAAGEQARFQTAPLTEELVLAGTGSVDLWVRSDATEAELEVVLSEVRPDGQEMRVQAGQLQASYRALDASSTELHPVQYGREEGYAPLVPGEWTQVRVLIPGFAHAFRAGSSIRIEINTPGGDTALWEFALDGPGAEATHVLGTGPDHPSSIALPVIAGLDAPTALPPCPSLRGQPCRVAPPIANQVVATVD